MKKIKERKDAVHMKQLHTALWTGLLLSTAPLSLLADSTWTGASSSDLNTAGNWDNNAVPTGATAFFQNTGTTNFNPTAVANFSVLDLDFVNEASAFTFTFTNCGLELDGGGITGSTTDTNITVTNTDNALVGNQILFGDATSNTSGSAILNVHNIGNSTTSSIPSDASQIFCQYPFSMNVGGKLNVTNSGTNTNGALEVGVVFLNQVRLLNPVTAEDNTIITVSNYGDRSGSGASQFTGYVSAQQFLVNSTFTAGDTVAVSVSNTGINSGSGSNYQTGFVLAPQLQVSDNLTAINNLNFTVSNSGTNSGTGSSSSTGYCGAGQVLLFNVGGCSVGSNFNLNVTNIGVDSSSGTGNLVGLVNGLFSNQAQAGVVAPFIATDGAIIAVSNEGTNTGSGHTNQTGYINSGHQLFMDSTFAAGNSLSVSLTNIGNDSSTGSGTMTVGKVDKDQFGAFSTFSVGDSATLTFTNSGTSSTSGTGSFTGQVAESQFFVADTFSAGNDLFINMTNTGLDNSSGAVTNDIGFVGNSQLLFSQTATVGNNATITLTNSGTNTNTASLSDVGFVNANQLEISGAFTSGTNLALTATNSGTTAGGSPQVGRVETQIFFPALCTIGSGQINVTNSGATSGNSSSTETGWASVNQLRFTDDVAVGSNTSITLSNTGTNSGSGSSNQTGFIGAQQFYAGSTFTAQDYVSIDVTNTGTNHGSGTGNTIGVVQAPQLQLSLTSVGTNMTLTVSNSGTNTSTGDSTSVGQCTASQLAVTGVFSVGNTLIIDITNTGVDTGSGAVNNSVGYVSGAQLNFEQAATVGDDATITLTNSGTSANAASTGDVGFINSNQLEADGAFTSGMNLMLSVSNSGTTAGGSSEVGHVTGSQILFTGLCTIDSGSTITAVNSGTGDIVNSQIWFQDGFALTSGTATFSASNSSSGTVGAHGIFVQGDCLGGDVNIVLANSSLFVDTTASTFFIGQLNGDSTSTVDSNVPFIINTDKGVIASFAGDIQSVSTSLTKAGLGVQVLTGTSSYTGATIVSGGALVVNGDITQSSGVTVMHGSLLLGTGSVPDTDVFGALKGGSPANPIGTLTVSGNLTLESGSHFATLVTPQGVSLVHATGTVTIDPGATYVAAFIPGNYHNTSAVVLTGGSVVGTFSGVDAIGFGPVFLAGVLSYTSTEVILGVSNRSVSALAEGGNAIQVASALDSAIAFNRTKVTFTIEPGPTIVGTPTPQLADILISIYPFTTEAEMTYALNQLHPAQLKGMAISQENNAVRVRESLTQRMMNELDVQNCLLSDNWEGKEDNCCKHEKRRMTAWVSGLGDTLKQNNENNYWGPLTGYRNNMGGVVAGIDTLFADHFYAGVLGGYTHSHLHFRGDKGTGNINTGYAGVYLSAMGSGHIGKKFYGNASVIGSWSGYSANRHIEYGDVNLVAKNNHGGNQLLAHLDTGLNFDILGLTLRPFDSFDYMTQVERGYAEHNAGEWELTVKRKNAIMMRNELGLQLAKCYCFGHSKWILSPKLSWVREVRVKGETFNVNFTQGGSPFVIHGYFPDRSLIAPGLAMTGLLMDDALTLDLYYNGEFTGGYSSNSFGGQIGYSF